MGPDVARIVIVYLELEQIYNFFDLCGVNYDIKFKCVVRRIYDNEWKGVLSVFPNVVVDQVYLHNFGSDRFDWNCVDLTLYSCTATSFCVGKGVKRLYVNYCKFLKVLDLTKCVDLEKIMIISCPELKDIIGIDGLSELRCVSGELWWKNGIFNMLPILREICVWGDCVDVISGFGEKFGEDVRKVDLIRSDLRNIDGLMRCGKIRELRLRDCLGFDVIRSLMCLTRLVKLVLINFDCVDLDALGKCKRLRSLRIESGKNLVSIEGLRGCVELKIVKIRMCTKLCVIDALGELKKLRKLRLSNVGISDVDVLGKCDRLSEVCISGAWMLGNVNGLGKCKELRHLYLGEIDVNVFRLEGCRKLEVLELIRVSGCGNLGGCESLVEFKMNECEVESLDILADCVRLKRIFVEECEDLWCIKDLRSCLNLEHVEIMNCHSLSDLDVLIICRRLRSVRLVNLALEEDEINRFIEDKLFERPAIVKRFML